MDPDQTIDQAVPARTRSRRWLPAALVAVIAVGLLVAGGGLAVALGIGRTDEPSADSVSAGFAQDMSRHHLQAVEMANLALQRSEDPEVRQLAFDISATQTGQAGRMRGWLSLWGLPATNRDVMAWMAGDGHAHHATTDGRPMPGMATEEELAELRSLTGTEFDVRFLQLMTRHHQGGLEMAEYGEEHAEVDVVRGLARSIAQSQTAETTTMVDMLRERGAAPLPFS
ncbi:DUF305 domain-containing protein [Modestobacter sp. SYSU DS0875]